MRYKPNLKKANDKPVRKEYKPFTTDDLYQEQEDDESDPIGEDPYDDLSSEEIAARQAEHNAKLDDALNENYGNPFPVEVFPKIIQNLIIDAERTNGYPIDFFASGILCAISAAMRNNFRIKFKAGFVESASLMLVLVGRPGTNKSQPLRVALQPLYDKENKYHEEYITAKRETNGNENIPYKKRLIISDATLEAVTQLLVENPSGLLLHVDEFSGFLDSMNKYRKGDDQQKWMSIWSNISFPVDRVSKESLFIKTQFITATGTIQPDLLTKFKEDLRGGNGFIDRILFAYPSNIECKPWSLEDINPQLLKHYNNIITSIIDTQRIDESPNNINPYVLKYSKNALKLLLDWQAENTDQVNDYTEDHLISMYKSLKYTYIGFR